MEKIATLNKSETHQQSVLPDHRGLQYQSFLPQLAATRRVKRYLEIGVQNGVMLSKMPIETAAGVDPYFSLQSDVSKGKKRVTLIQRTSDEFFADEDPLALLSGHPDLAFLDGMHTFEYLLRDFYNTEAICRPNSLIAIHDCLPVSVAMMVRNEIEAKKVGANDPHPNWWTGDVWKIIPILKEYRPDLKIVCVNSQPTGLVFVTNLNPASSTLRERYVEIIDKYRVIPNDEHSLNCLYSENEIVAAEKILTDFDESLYFRR